MSNIYGLLNIEDYRADRTYINQLGQSIVYDAIQQEIDRINSEINSAISIFVDETTEDTARRYKLAGGGYMQPRARLARPAETKFSGSWDVAFPLLDFGDAISQDSITIAYMSARDLNMHLDTIQMRAGNTIRREILRAIFNNVDWAFEDEHAGTLNVKPLANGDNVLYPPLPSADDPATDNHYLASGYASSSISDTNDPFEVIGLELYQHFDATHSNGVVFFNSAQTAKVMALTDIEEINDPHIRMGANANEVIGLPSNLPGRLKGRHVGSGLWAVEWDRIPVDYLVGVDLDAPKPIIERVDPASIGLPRGLALVARDERFPLETSYYLMRRGFGISNRLNGVVMQLTTGSYTIPSAYAR